MIMPAYTTLPESLLAPSQIADKFNVQTFAGLGALGCDCSETDDEGDCLDPDPCSTGSTDTGSTGSTAAEDSLMDCMNAGYTGYNPNTGSCTTSSGASAGSAAAAAGYTGAVPFCADNGNVQPCISQVTSSILSPSGTPAAQLTAAQTCQAYGFTLGSNGLCTSGTASSVSSSPIGSQLSAAQQAQLNAGILKGGLTLAELLAIQPGQAILPNGTIVSGGTGALAAGSLASLGASFTSMLPLLLIAGIGIMLLTRK
jgi:hypothetical protein